MTWDEKEDAQFVKQIENMSARLMNLTVNIGVRLVNQRKIKVEETLLQYLVIPIFNNAKWRNELLYFRSRRHPAHE
jgi:hypothetical protein